jgi:hypothetical protein
LTGPNCWSGQAKIAAFPKINPRVEKYFSTYTIFVPILPGNIKLARYFFIGLRLIQLSDKDQVQF